MWFFFFSSRRRHTRCALVTGVQTCALPIYLDGNPDDPDTPVRLVPRQRNAPLDRMVAEYMILANNVWGGLLHQHGVPGIYRSQQAGRVRMSTQALPHEEIGRAHV